MYCMTNVMRFQQQYLNWQIYNWTRINNNHIKIHLQVGERRGQRKGRHYPALSSTEEE